MLYFILGYVIGNLICGLVFAFYVIRKAKKNKIALDGLKQFFNNKTREVTIYDDSENN